jgi:hypothetical protein
MKTKEMEYHQRRLKQGEIYLDKVNNEKVEFGYMGQTGWAICYEPGDSRGGMQSSFGINPNNLEFIVDETPR